MDNGIRKLPTDLQHISSKEVLGMYINLNSTRRKEC